VLLWEIFSLGYMPYPGRSNMDVIELVTAGGRLDILDTCPSTVNEMMTSCWSRNADQRPSFTDIVQRLQVTAAFSLNRSPVIPSVLLLHSYRPIYTLRYIRSARDVIFVIILSFEK